MSLQARTSKTSQSDVDIAQAAIEKAKVAIGIVRGVDKDKLYTSPVFAELVHFFLSVAHAENEKKVLHD